MTAVWNVTGDTARVDILQADGAVRMRDILHARVPVLQLNRQAHIALGTVKESVATADPAYSAAVTVILILVFVVEQIAFEARVFAEPAVAVLASGLYRLTGVAQHAYQLRDFLSVYRVGLLFIVTKPTRVHFVATGCHELGLSFVVLAAVIVVGPVVRKLLLLGRGRALGDGPRFVVVIHIALVLYACLFLLRRLLLLIDSHVLSRFPRGAPD